jgi:glycosyltransferase involved in cell wall biosynthesis
MNQKDLDKKITAGIISKNAASSIKHTLDSLSWVDNIIVADDHSTDSTVEIVKNYTKNILTVNAASFAEKRNIILQNTASGWLFYVDADEIVTPELAKEMRLIIESGVPGFYKVKRQNFFLGTKMYPDSVDRLFHKSVIKGWAGEVHESPIVEGESKQLQGSLIHHTHTDIASMLAKTNHWSEFESDLRIKANHPPIAWWRLVRITITVFWQQFFKLGVGRYGRAGVFEGYFQIIDKLIVYTKVWEKQRK